MSTSPQAASRSAVTAAVNDPFGARLVLLEYGRLADFPDISVGPMQLKGGEDGWTRALNLAQPLWLGVAWQRVEILEEGLQRERARIDAIKANTRAHAQSKGDHVPIVAWTDAGAGLADGTYSAVITEITEEEGNYGPQFRFQFVVLDGDGEETDDQIRGWCSQKWGAKTKLYKWAKSLLGKRCPGENQPLDTDKLLKRKCDLVVSTKPGKERGSIEELFPFRTVNALASSDDEESL